MHFTIADSDYTATIYESADDGARVMGTISRPRVTRAHQKALPNGDKWTVAATDGTTVLVRNIRPPKSLIKHALDTYRAAGNS